MCCKSSKKRNSESSHSGRENGRNIIQWQIKLSQLLVKNQWSAFLECIMLPWKKLILSSKSLRWHRMEWALQILGKFMTSVHDDLVMLMWSLLICKISSSIEEANKRKIYKSIRKWLGVSPGLQTQNWKQHWNKTVPRLEFV